MKDSINEIEMWIEDIENYFTDDCEVTLKEVESNLKQILPMLSDYEQRGVNQLLSDIAQAKELNGKNKELLISESSYCFELALLRTELDNDNPDYYLEKVRDLKKQATNEQSIHIYAKSIFDDFIKELISKTPDSKSKEETEPEEDRGK